MDRHTGRAVRLLVAAVLVAALTPVRAGADIFEVPSPLGSSKTNPGEISSFSAAWREGWGNTPLPSFDLVVPQPDEGQTPIYGAVYLLARPETPITITPDMWSRCYWAATGRSTWNALIDVPGEVANPGPFFGPNTLPPGATRPYEGPFTLWYQYLAKDEAAGAMKAAVNFGLDVTPPEKVTGVVPRPGIGLPPVTGVLPQSRVHVTWDDKVYDRLAGTGYFAVFLNGRPYTAPGSGEPVRVYDMKEHYAPHYGLTVNTPRAVTLENLPAGRSTIQIQAVDRATNEGPLSDPVTVIVDPDIPTVEITWPLLNGQVIGVTAPLTANVIDAGGIRSVKFFVDGVLLGTVTSPPYALSADLSSFADGTTHVVRVVAEDFAGRTNYAEKEFTLDKQVPRISALSAGPSPFYPRARDGYKDDFVVRFSSSEAATATLTIKSGKRVVRRVSKAIGIGPSSFKWNGKDSKGEVAEGSYTWQLSLMDPAGNRTATTARTVRIAFTELVKTGPGTVRVIQR